MIKLFRILGKRGRVTIPQEIRQRVGFAYNDVLSFAEQDDRTVVIKREKLCDDCCDNLKSTDKSTNDKALLQFLDTLSPAEQRAALIHLSVLWGERQDKTANEKYKSLSIE